VSGFDFEGEIYVPSKDPDCIIWTRFESTPSINKDDIQGVNYWQVTAGNTYCATSSQHKEGIASCYTDFWLLPGGGLNQGFNNDRATLALIDFPGMVNGPHNFIASIWLHTTWRDSNTLRFATSVPQFEGGWNISIISAAGGYSFQAKVTNSSAASVIISAAGDQMWNNRWYHLALWSSHNVGNSGLIVWDDLAKVEFDYDAHTPGVCGGVYTASTNRFFLGVHRSGRMFMDSFVVCTGDRANKQSFINKIREIRSVT
jgi:hypothetical protein